MILIISLEKVKKDKEFEIKNMIEIINKIMIINLNLFAE